MKSDYLKEACIESLQEAQTAHKQGADLLEVCSHLDQDGLTPSPNLVQQIIDSCDIPLKIMIRPSHRYQSAPKEWPQILDQINTFKSLNIQEIVVGYLNNNRLDIPLITEIAKAAFPMHITVHKAIDQSQNIEEDIEALKLIPNVKSILSSGAACTAKEGLEMLNNMKEWCGEEINLIAAGKVTHKNVEELHQALGLKHYHGRRIMS